MYSCWNIFEVSIQSTKNRENIVCNLNWTPSIRCSKFYRCTHTFLVMVHRPFAESHELFRGMVRAVGLRYQVLAILAAARRHTFLSLLSFYSSATPLLIISIFRLSSLYSNFYVLFFARFVPIFSHSDTLLSLYRIFYVSDVLVNSWINREIEVTKALLYSN